MAFLYLGVAAALYGSIATLAKPQLLTIHPILLSSSIYLIIGIVLTILIKLTHQAPKINKSELKYILIDFSSVAYTVLHGAVHWYKDNIDHEPYTKENAYLFDWSADEDYMEYVEGLIQSFIYNVVNDYMVSPNHVFICVDCKFIIFNRW